jgi:hypothetical protein
MRAGHNNISHRYTYPGTIAPISLLTIVHPARARPASTSVPLFAPCRNGRRLRCSPGLRLIAIELRPHNNTTATTPPSPPPTNDDIIHNIPCALRDFEERIILAVFLRADTAIARQEVDQTTKGLPTVAIASTCSHRHFHITPHAFTYPCVTAALAAYKTSTPASESSRLPPPSLRQSPYLSYHPKSATGNRSTPQSSLWREKR